MITIPAYMPATLLLGLALLASPLRAEDAAEAVVDLGEAAYVSGGVGEESRERLKVLESGFGFNLKVIFAQQSGDYLSDVDLRVVDAAGTTVLQAGGVGPIVLLRLPAGRYALVAERAGSSLRQRIGVGDGRPGRLVFRWPDD